MIFFHKNDKNKLVGDHWKVIINLRYCTDLDPFQSGNIAHACSYLFLITWQRNKQKRDKQKRVAEFRENFFR